MSVRAGLIEKDSELSKGRLDVELSHASEIRDSHFEMLDFDTMDTCRLYAITAMLS